MNENQCPICGGPVALTMKVREVHIGQRTVDVQYEAPECLQCGEVFYGPEDMDALQRRASQTIRSREGLLQPEAIRRLRETLHLSQVELEQLLGVGPKTVVRWERGTVFQNAATDSLLRVLAAVPDAVRYLARMKGVAVQRGAVAAPRIDHPADAARDRRFHYTEADPQVIPFRERLQVPSAERRRGVVPDFASDARQQEIA